MRNALVQATGAVGRFRAALAQASGSGGQFRTATSQSTTQVRQLKTAADQAARSVQQAGRQAASGGGFFSRFSQGLRTATTAQRGLNTAMKANVLGFLLSLLLPLISKIVDMAMQSQRVRQVVSAAFRIIGQVVGAVMDFVRKIISAVWPWIETYVRTYITIVMTVIRTVMNVIQTVISTVWNVISTIFRTAMNVISTVVSGAWNGIKNVIMPVITWIGEAIPAVWNRVTGALRAAWDGLAGFARAAFEAVLGAVKAPINAIIGLVNMAIRGLNSISVTIPDWVPFVGGKTFGLNLPQIPQLAAGGIATPVPGGRLVNVAEAGHAEAIIPLSKLPQLLDLTNKRRDEKPVTVNIHPRARQSEYEIGRIAARELAWAGKR
ncbi:hypothetical protein [Amycolatopsis sp. lyj-84]|uniref:phage tail protein n=1 Tax=Amycolatopsis sp. lyj-84 TaxID=2789284 RepID=UPI00397D42D1